MISRAHKSGSHEKDSAPYNRTLVFFDAIYAFALTLLITTIDPPSPESWRNVDALLSDGLGTELMGFLISFAVIVSFWRANVKLVDRLSELTPRIIFFNVITVGLIIFIPLTTEAFSDGDAVEYVLPVVVYAVNVSLICFAAIATRATAYREGVYIDPPSLQARRIALVGSLEPAVIILMSIPVAIIFGGVAGHYWWLMLIFFGQLAGRWSTKRLKALGEAEKVDS